MLDAPRCPSGRVYDILQVEEETMPKKRGRILTAHTVSAWETPSIADFRDEAMAAVRLLPVKKDPQRRIFGEELAKVMGAKTLARAFDQDPLSRAVSAALAELPTAEQRYFLEWHWCRRLPFGRSIGRFTEECARFWPFRIAAYLVGKAGGNLAKARALQEQAVRNYLEYADRASAQILGHGKRMAPRRLWPERVRLIGERDWEEVYDILPDADWQDVDRAAGRVIGPFYPRYADAWNDLKSLIGHCIQRALRAHALAVGVKSPHAELARVMRMDLWTLSYDAAGMMMDGRLGVNGRHANPALALVWIFWIGCWPVGAVGEVPWVLRPPPLAAAQD